jgi:hypothetical protein
MPLTASVGPESRSESCEEEINLFPLLGFEPKFFQAVALSLCCLQYPGTLTNIKTLHIRALHFNDNYISYDVYYQF